MKKLKDKLNTVIRQYKKNWDVNVQGREHPYIETLQEIENWLFSDDINKKENSLKRLKSLLLTYRAWEDNGFDFFDQTDKYKDKFVDDFKNWDEWYDFLESIVKDAHEYVEYYKKDAIS